MYVDDITCMCKDKTILTEEIDNILQKFQGTNEGPISWYLGISISREPGRITLSQKAYIDSLLLQYHMVNANIVSTTMAKSFYSDVENVPLRNSISSAKYRNLIGPLSYLANRTRPDICPAVNILSQYQTAPNDFLWTCALRVLKYLKGTREYILTYHNGEESSFEGFVDADFANDTVSRKSRTGFVMKISGNEYDWCSKRQTVTVISTAEAETYAVSECLQRILFPRNVLEEIGFLNNVPILHCDNALAVAWANASAGRRRA